MKGVVIARIISERPAPQPAEKQLCIKNAHAGVAVAALKPLCFLLKIHF
jgi:hypothetical protein